MAVQPPPKQAAHATKAKAQIGPPVSISLMKANGETNALTTTMNMHPMILPIKLHSPIGIQQHRLHDYFPPTFTQVLSHVMRSLEVMRTAEAYPITGLIMSRRVVRTVAAADPPP